MVKHIVMWKLKEFAEGKTRDENFKIIKSRLEALPADIPEIRHIEVGINFSKGSDGFDAVLYSEFDSAETLEIYQNHPKHKETAAFVALVRNERVVGDYIII